MFKLRNLICLLLLGFGLSILNAQPEIPLPQPDGRFELNPHAAPHELPNSDVPRTSLRAVSSFQRISSNDSPVLSQNTIACVIADGSHLENSYYRVFDLNGLGSFTLTNVIFGIESSQNNADVVVIVHALANDVPFTVENLVELTRYTPPPLNIPNPRRYNVVTELTNASGDTQHLYTNVPANHRVVVEIYTPSARELTDVRFHMGSNNDSNIDARVSEHSYIRAPDCKIDEPTPLSLLDGPNTDTAQFVMAIEGYYDLRQMLPNVTFQDTQTINNFIIPNLWTPNKTTDLGRRRCNKLPVVYFHCHWYLSSGSAPIVIRSATPIDPPLPVSAADDLVVFTLLYAGSEPPVNVNVRLRVTYVLPVEQKSTELEANDTTVSVRANGYYAINHVVKLERRARRYMAVISLPDTTETYFLASPTLHFIDLTAEN